MNWKDLHNAICTTLKREISIIQTCEIYPSIRKELVAPAVFVELIPTLIINEPNKKHCRVV